MSMPPRVRRILTPATIPDSLLSATTNNPQQLTSLSVSNLAASADLSRTRKTSTANSNSSHAAAAGAGSTNYTVQRNVALHPTYPLVGYLLEEMIVTVDKQTNLIVGAANVVGVPHQATPKTTTKPSLLHKYIVVQSATHSQEITYCVSIQQIAVQVFGSMEPQKVIQAVKALGEVQSLQFYDPSTLYWSGMMNCNPGAVEAADGSSHSRGGHDNNMPQPLLRGAERWQALCLQTDKRILLLNLQQGPCSRGVASAPLPGSTCVLAHLHEQTLAAIPSSNCLPLTDTWLLVGCTDGSLKCYDWKAGTVIKSIKGLGKGDWIVQLAAANRYNHWSEDPSNTGSQASSRRILTMTKKGICYLIELDVSGQILEIKPPLARFVGGLAECPTTVSDNIPMEHVLMQYDAHNDLILWFHPTPKHAPPTLYVWNLRVLQEDLVQQQTGGKTLFKPDPNLSILFPALAGENASGSAGQNFTVLSGLVHSSFDQDTVLSATITREGDFYLTGAVAHRNNTVSSCSALPVLVCSVAATLQRDAESEDLLRSDPSEMNLRVHSMVSRPLPETHGCELTLATNWGILILEVPPLVTANDLRPSAIVGASHLHFGAGLGSLGKSVLQVHHSTVSYGSLDVLKPNPVGALQPKNIVTVYESPPSQELPTDLQKRPFRLTPTLLSSPSGMYVALFWADEYRYEILHIPTVLQMVGQQRSSGATGAGLNQMINRNPVVASGSGIIGFAWVGDDDVFCLLHNAAVMERAIASTAMAVAAAKEAEGSGGGGLSLSMKVDLQKFGRDLTDIRGSAKKAAKFGLKTTKMTRNVTVGVAKATTGVALSAGKTTLNTSKSLTLATGKAAHKTTKTALNITKATATEATKATKRVGKGMKKSLKVFGFKKKKSADGSGKGSGGLIDESDEEEDEMATENDLAAQVAMAEAALEGAGASSSGDFKPEMEDNRRYVEMVALVATESSTQLGGSISAATTVSLGEPTLRGGNRNPPTVMFGGPVLCVASRSDENEQGHAHFYTRKKDATDNSASMYVSSGPTLPYPDICAWDEDGRLCAIVVQSRVAVYLSEIPEFTLLGTVRIASSWDPDSCVTSVKFFHGVLYCCTWNAVYCTFLGDLSGRVCLMDTYCLASTNVPILPDASLETMANKYSSFSPPTLPLPLVQPSAVGYQNGSLVVSTIRGIQAIPLCHPALRIGILLASGQVDRATKWFDAVPDSDHEALATFLERRGHPQLGLVLPGLSLESIVDLSMRYGYAGRLEEVVETFGARGLRAIDMGRGVSSSIFGPEPGYSVVVCVGAFLLAHGRVEVARRLASECLRTEDGRKDALVLGALLLSVDEADASRLISRAVEEGSPTADGRTADWLIGHFVHDHVLSKSGPGAGRAP